MSQLNKIHLALFDEKTRVDETFDGRNRELLVCIDQMREEGSPRPGSDQGEKWEVFDLAHFDAEHSMPKQTREDDIDGIMVVVGTGSFTSTRIGVVVANTWAFAKQIPLLAITEQQVENVQSLISELLKQPKGQYISATYSGEPNIGKHKS